MLVNYHSLDDTLYRGEALANAQGALLCVHGRGADGENILGIADYLHTAGLALIAPQARGYTWYPYSFLAPPEQNEPGLSSGLALLKALVDQCREAGLADHQIYLLGFSQGACLTLEFAARNARRYGGVFALSGGLIGDKLEAHRYTGDFAQTPIFLGCSDVDPHIPLQRVRDSAALLRERGALVTESIYPQMPHTIVEDELHHINAILDQRERSV